MLNFKNRDCFIENIIKMIVILIMTIIISNLYAFGQSKGTFTEQIIVNNNQVNLYYYVPENYNPNTKYTLITGLPNNPAYGNTSSEQIGPIAEELDAIFVCPDYTNKSLYWNNDLISSAINHAKQNYNIDNSKIILTGYIHGAKFIFNWGVGHNKEITGMIGYAPDLSNFNIEPDIIKKLPLGLIAGSEDVWKMYPDEVYKTYQDNNGKCRYIIKDVVDQMGPYYTRPEFISDWIECYNYIISNTPAGLDDYTSDIKLRITPNPYQNEAVISLTGFLGHIRVSLIDCLGNEVETLYSGYNQNNYFEIKLDIGKKVNGVYYLRVNSENFTLMEKIINMK